MRRILLVVLCMWSAWSWATQIVVTGTNLNLGPGWGLLYTDAPEGGYLATFGEGSITATVQLNQAVSPGTYSVFVKGIDYLFGGPLTPPTNWVVFGGSTSTVQYLNYRDASGEWSTNCIVTSVSSASNIVVHFSGDEGADKFLFRALYITSDTNEIVLKEDRAVLFNYPGASDIDSNAPTGGNLVPNGSFEVGVGSFWRIVTGDHAENNLGLWVTNLSHSGVCSLKLPCPTNDLRYAIESNPILCASNKQHTLSAWVRSSAGTNSAWVYLINTYVTPDGFTAVQNLNAGISVTTNWQLLKLTTNILYYPNSEVYISLQAQQSSGGDVYFDDVMLVQGQVTNFIAKSQFEVGVIANEPTRVFWNSANTNLLTFRAFNWSSNAINKTVSYTILNWTNTVSASGSLSVSVNPGTFGSTAFTVPTNYLGHFRMHYWIDGTNVDNEATYVMTTEPGSVAPTNSIIGTHCNWQSWQLSALKRLGAKWNRQLSPDALYRWSLAEPTEGTYLFYDYAVSNNTNFGFVVMGNIGEALPTWATNRLQLGTTNVVGTFQAGELVAGGLATGRVAVVLFSTNGPGTSLQLTNSSSLPVVGTWSGSITGLTSGATADVRGAPYNNAVPFEKWERFVSNIVNHYTAVKYWEDWNEPDHKSNNGIPDMAFYAEIARRFVLQVKAVGANAIIGGGLLTDAQINEVRNRLPTNFETNAAAWSIHHYPGNESNTTNSLIKAVWNTETGPAGDRGSYTGHSSPYRKAGRYVIGFSGANIYYNNFSTGIETMGKNFLASIGGYGKSRYFLYDARQSNISPNDWTSAQWTMFDYDGSIKTKGACYSALAHLFDGSVGQGELRPNDTNTLAFLFLRGGTIPLMAFWSKSVNSNKTATLNSNISTNDILVYDLMGNATRPSSLALQFGRMPIIVEGQGSLSQSNLAHSLTNGTTIVGRGDTHPPNLAITYAPRVDDGLPRHVRWLALEDRDTPDVAMLDGIQYRYKVGSSSFSAWDASTFVNLPTSVEWPQTFTVEARDLSGNTSTNTITFGTNPTIPIITIGGNVTISGKVSIQ